MSRVLTVAVHIRAVHIRCGVTRQEATRGVIIPAAEKAENCWSGSDLRGISHETLVLWQWPPGLKTGGVVQGWRTRRAEANRTGKVGGAIEPRLILREEGRR
jgi:hypothetical protein